MNEKYLKWIYTFWAIIYDSILDKVFSFDRDKVIHLFSIDSHPHIIEVGVGTGLNLPHYPEGCTVTGIDFSTSMLDKARQKISQAHVTLIAMDARKMSFKNNSFDHALGTFILRVTPNPKQVLLEVSRVVKPGGKFALVDQFYKRSLAYWIVTPLTLLLGWGSNPNIHDLIKGTGWCIDEGITIGQQENTRIIILCNEK